MAEWMGCRKHGAELQEGCFSCLAAEHWNTHERAAQQIDELPDLHTKAVDDSADLHKAERAAFEAWASAHGFNITRDDSEKYRDYHRSTTRWAWQAWQARATPGVKEALK